MGELHVSIYPTTFYLSWMMRAGSVAYSGMSSNGKSQTKKKGQLHADRKKLRPYRLYPAFLTFKTYIEIYIT